jgi:hypothetical protein
MGPAWSAVLADRTLTLRPRFDGRFDDVLVPQLQLVPPSVVDTVVVHVGEYHPSPALLAALAPFTRHELVRPAW